jgi:hypothetical protein
MDVYKRHSRYSLFDRLRYSRNLLGFLVTQAERLSVTEVNLEVTFSNGSNQVHATGHGLASGAGPFLLTNAGGALPTGLDGETPYFVHAQNDDTLTLHLSESDAVDELDVVEFTTNGTGTSALGVEESSVTTGMIFNLLKTHTAEQIKSLAAFPL